MRPEGAKHAAGDPACLGPRCSDHFVAGDNGELELARHLLKPAGNIDGIADHGEFEPPLAADLAEDDLAAMNADADEELRQAGRGAAVIPGCNFVDHLTAAAQRVRGILRPDPWRAESRL